MKPNVLLVAHDAGGAQVLFHWSQKHQAHYQFFYRLEGPARKYFQHKELVPQPEWWALFEPLNPKHFVLTGSSLEACLERDVIQEAKERGIRCVTFLDHWDLYRERFSTAKNWHDFLPDEIWVGDSWAQKKALEDGFPANKVLLKDNPYFDAIKKGYASLQEKEAAKNKSGNILYICEPVHRKLLATFGSQAASYPDEHQILENFLENLIPFQKKINKVTLRLHPQEHNMKYATLMQHFQAKLPIHLSNEKLLPLDILHHQKVVGVESMGLVIALLFNKEVYSYLPGKPWTISLPQSTIKRIEEGACLFS